MSTHGAARGQAASGAARGTHPTVALIISIVLGIFAITFIATQVRTTEAYFMHTVVTNATPDFSVFNQIPGIWQGGLGDYQQPALYAYALEFLYIALAIAGDVFMAALGLTGKIIGGALRVALLFLIGFDGYTDYNNGYTVGYTGPGGHWTFTLVTICAVFLLTFFSIKCFEHFLKHK